MRQRNINLYTEHLARGIIPERHRALFWTWTNHDRRGRSLDAQENDAGDLHADGVRERATHTQLALRVLHLHARRLVLHDAHPVVDVQHTRGSAVHPRRDDKLEIRRTQLRRRHRARCPEREHRAAADVQRDRREIDVGERDVLSFTLDGCERREIVELVLGEVNRHRRRVLLGYRRNEDRVTIEELQVDAKRRRVRRILEPERVEDRRPIHARSMEDVIEIIEQAIPLRGLGSALRSPQ
jgi:hypothetical protein